MDTLTDPATAEVAMVPADRAATLAGVSRQRLWYWERTALVQPTVRRHISERNIVRLYAFPELVQLITAAALRRMPDITLQGMRTVLDYLREAGYRAPLGELRFAVSGGSIYFQHPDGSWAYGRAPQQTVEPRVLNLQEIHHTAWAGLHEGRRPADFGRVVKRRGTMGSKPVFKGTRVPVAAVLEWFDAGRGPGDVLRAYPALREEDLSIALLLRSIGNRLRAGASFAEIRAAYPHLTDDELRSAEQIPAA